MRGSKVLIAAACLGSLLWTSSISNMMNAETPAPEQLLLEHTSSQPASASLTQASASMRSAAAAQMPQQADKPVHDVVGVHTGKLTEALDIWLEALSADPQFRSWNSAERTISPLGPGTHGWVVILSHEQQEIGYVIVHADEQGRLLLSEYGSGPHVLFSMKALQQHAKWNGLTEQEYSLAEAGTDGQVKLLYVSPAEALYMVASDDAAYPVNAKNGEWYQLDPPLQLEDKRAYHERINAKVQHVYDHESMRQARIESYRLPPFDAFAQTLWLDGEEVEPDSFDTLAKRLDHGDRIIAVTEAFGEILITWPVTGYQLWNGETPYLLVRDNGERFIPFDAATMKFYTEPTVHPS